MRVDLYFLFFKEVKEKKEKKHKNKTTTTTKRRKKRGGWGGKLLIEKTDNTTNYQGKGIDQYLFLFFGLPGGDSHS